MDTETARLGDEADRAARRGDVAEARRLLELIVSTPDADADLHLKLAAMRRAGGDPKGALAATDCALALDPLHFVGLMLRATLLERLDLAGSGEAFGRALAQRPPGALTPQLEAMIAHAVARHTAYQHQAEQRLSLAVAESAALLPEEQSRLARFRSNAVRLTKPYHSEPTHYHYPGLAEREFHDRGGFDWLKRVEAETDAIADEFSRVVAAERVSIEPYVQYPDGEPLRQWQALNHSADWSAIHLIKNGMRTDANARYCPQTMAMLANLPQPDIPGLSPNAMFSLLAPHAHIPPHTGVANSRLVCHLPLTVPRGCWFRVGAERREWRRGEAWIFDDTIEHEAANDSDDLRVILIFDIWHPGLSDRERAAVAATVAEHDRAIDGGL